jgi:hypothetical protein
MEPPGEISHREWTVNAAPSAYLYGTRLPISGRDKARDGIPKPAHDFAYWAARTAGFDSSKEDNLGDPEKFNRIIWKGLKGTAPYPSGTGSNRAPDR